MNNCANYPTFLVVAFVIALTELVSKINTAPQWLDKVPCTFQSVFNDFVKLLSAAETFLAFFDIIPSLFVVLMGVYVLRKANREADDSTWQPMPWKILLATYVIKLLAPVGQVLEIHLHRKAHSSDAPNQICL